MKAERRHDLHTNTLARGIKELPNVGREYGSKILLVITLVLLVAVAARWWLSNRSARIEKVAANLTESERLLGQLRGLPVWQPGLSAKQIDDIRTPIRGQIEAMVSDVLGNSSDAAQQAEAHLIHADMNWELGSRTVSSPTTGPTSGPALVEPPKSTDFIRQAEEEYKLVLDSAQAGQLSPETTARARLGLAAIAEERGDWNSARSQYEAIEHDAHMGEALRDQARWRREALASLGNPVVLGHPWRPEPVSRPSTQPSTMPANPLAPEGPPAPATTVTEAPTTAPATTAPAVIPITMPTAAPAAEPTPSAAPTTGPTTTPSSP